MLSNKWVHIVLVIILALAALLFIRLHQAEDQPAPMFKGTRTCSQQANDCNKNCQNADHLDQCMKGCARDLQQCLMTGCWIGSKFRYCGLVKQ